MLLKKISDVTEYFLYRGDVIDRHLMQLLKISVWSFVDKVPAEGLNVTLQFCDFCVQSSLRSIDFLLWGCPLLTAERCRAFDVHYATLRFRFLYIREPRADLEMATAFPKKVLQNWLVLTRSLTRAPLPCTAYMCCIKLIRNQDLEYLCMVIPVYRVADCKALFMLCWAHKWPWAKR